MKVVLGTVFLALFAVTFAQEESITVTEDLLRAQGQLTIGHEFAETLLAINRGQISAYMNLIGRALIDSHMEAYGRMKDDILQTNDTLNSFSVTPQNEICLNAVRNRWSLQVSRFGQRLARCLDVPNRMLNAWDRFLLNIHVTGQINGNQVQNLGNKVLSETLVFDEMESYTFLINREFRMLLSRLQPYRNSFDGFLEDISREQEQAIQILIQCDRNLEDDLTTEIEHDLALAEECVAA